MKVGEVWIHKKSFAKVKITKIHNHKKGDEIYSQNFGYILDIMDGYRPEEDENDTFVSFKFLEDEKDAKVFEEIFPRKWFVNNFDLMRE